MGAPIYKFQDKDFEWHFQKRNTNIINLLLLLLFVKIFANESLLFAKCITYIPVHVEPILQGKQRIIQKQNKK